VLADDAYSVEMFNRRQSVVLFGSPAWIASAEDVLLHKLYWNTVSPSDRQTLDAAGVWCVQQDKLDLSYMSKWARLVGSREHAGNDSTRRIRPKNS